MSNAWETTSDDVLIVLEQNGVEVSVDVEEWRLDEIVDFQLDHEAIEKAALNGDDMEQQTNYAHDEIKKQLKRVGVI